MGCDMDEIERLKTIFPYASPSFLEANAGLLPDGVKQTSRPTLVGAVPGKEKSDDRVSLCYVLYRVRLLDPDNAYGATKTITDCLCQVGLIPGDAANQVKITVEQEKVRHIKDQKTTLHIQYP